MRKLFFITLLTLLVPFQAFSYEDARKPTLLRFRIAHGPLNVVEPAVAKFKEAVEAKTNGRVRVQAIPTNSLAAANRSEVQRSLREVEAGRYEMTQAYVGDIAERIPSYHALELPFIMRDHDHAKAVIDGPIGAELLSMTEKEMSLKALAFTYSGGYRIIATGKKELHKLDDLRGLKISRDLDPPRMKFFEKLGVEFRPVRQGKVGIENAITKGEIEGFQTPYPRYANYPGHLMAAPLVNPFHESIQFTVFVINKTVFEKLSPEERQIIQEAAIEAALLERKVAVSYESAILTTPEKFKVRISHFPPEDIKKAAKIAAEMDWSDLKIPKSLIERVKKEGLSKPR